MNGSSTESGWVSLVAITLSLGFLAALFFGALSFLGGHTAAFHVKTGDILALVTGVTTVAGTIVGYFFGVRGGTAIAQSATQDKDKAVADRHKADQKVRSLATLVPEQSQPEVAKILAQ